MNVFTLDIYDYQPAINALVPEPSPAARTHACNQVLLIFSVCLHYMSGFMSTEESRCFHHCGMNHYNHSLVLDRASHKWRRVEEICVGGGGLLDLVRRSGLGLILLGHVLDLSDGGLYH